MKRDHTGTSMGGTPDWVEGVNDRVRSSFPKMARIELANPHTGTMLTCEGTNAADLAVRDFWHAAHQADESPYDYVLI